MDNLRAGCVEGSGPLGPPPSSAGASLEFASKLSVWLKFSPFFFCLLSRVHERYMGTWNTFKTTPPRKSVQSLVREQCFHRNEQKHNRPVCLIVEKQQESHRRQRRGVFLWCLLEMSEFPLVPVSRCSCGKTRKKSLGALADLRRENGFVLASSFLPLSLLTCGHLRMAAPAVPGGNGPGRREHPPALCRAGLNFSQSGWG